ncbi:hypothetical protein GUJ93_ZPchr0115g2735 [Zizania palustris]|uniref:Uncharacterized protein n=1 Tax=Zizania palustris TaxID=103762 RepID=A0A8J5RQJ9_ZIZPA|nr:hypothetical protein GUJ93_ZPchr0115g2735 [Zizania palustris]
MHWPSYFLVSGHGSVRSCGNCSLTPGSSVRHSPARSSARRSPLARPSASPRFQPCAVAAASGLSAREQKKRRPPVGGAHALSAAARVRSIDGAREDDNGSYRRKLCVEEGILSKDSDCRRMCVEQLWLSVICILIEGIRMHLTR